MNNISRKGLIGKKIGMTHVFSTEGKQIAVTLVEVEKNVVTQLKTQEKDGYEAVQLSAGNNKLSRFNSPVKGKFKKLDLEPKKVIREIRTSNTYDLKTELDVSIFEAGELVDVSALTKGRGFTGSIKRHNQSRGPMAHGSGYHRGVGSMGAKNHNRIFKGKNMPGHYGHEKVTIQNLEIIEVNTEKNFLLIKGAIPGPKNAYITVRSSIKHPELKNKPTLLVGVN